MRRYAERAQRAERACSILAKNQLGLDLPKKLGSALLKGLGPGLPEWLGSVPEKLGSDLQEQFDSGLPQALGWVS